MVTPFLHGPIPSMILKFLALEIFLISGYLQESSTKITPPLLMNLSALLKQEVLADHVELGPK